MLLPPPPSDYATRMPRCSEPASLTLAGPDAFGRDVYLSEDAATAWHTLRVRAESDGVRLLLLSGYRSVERQTEIIARKLAQGQTLDAILRVNAYPGHSEHHTGNAIDIGSPDCEHLSEAFEFTREFAWLTHNAGRFGFTLSYPRDNPLGINHEPWHWCWHPLPH